MKTIVVGAAGLIGGAVAARLRAEDIDVLGVDIRLGPEVNRIASAAQALHLFAAGDLVVLAWGNPSERTPAVEVAEEVATNMRLVDVCERLGCRLIYFSSMWIDHGPELPYSVGKLAMERRLSASALTYVVDRVGSCMPAGSPRVSWWADEVRVSPSDLARRVLARLEDVNRPEGLTIR